MILRSPVAEVADSPSIGASRATPERLSGLDVVIVHDYLNQPGGAERVALELSDMWPRAPIYTSLYRPDSTLPSFRDRDVRTTLLDMLPIDRGFRNLFPLYPLAFRSLGQIDADVVLASSSGWAHLARPKPHALHAVYCHTPARWLYGAEHLRLSSAKRRLAKPLLRPLRRVDRAAAARADLYIANSETVRRRIRAAYGIEAAVVPPPVDVDRFQPTPRGDRLLTVSRLLPYKHIELVVRAATRAGIGLDVVGDGPLLSALRDTAGPKVRVLGSVDDASVVDLMQTCRAVCVAAEEDFGMAAVEAQAAGKPVIAYGRGGSLETVEHGLTGILFQERTEESLVRAIRACDRLDTSPERIAHRARRFSRSQFRARLAQELERALPQGI